MIDLDPPGGISALLAMASKVLAEQQRELKASAKRFNVFESISFVHYELRHTEFIGFLLDPHATHDQGADFLEAFLIQMGVSHLASLDHARVFVELPIRNRQLDIFIHVPGLLALIIENKIWSGESRNQIIAYQEWLLTNHSECNCTAVLFLSPTGQEPQRPHDVPQVIVKTYKDIREWLGRFDSLGGQLGSTIKMYREISSLLIGEKVDHQYNQDVTNLLKTADNFDAAWAIASSLKKVKTHLVAEYWARVAASINEQIGKWEGPVKWEAKITKYRNGAEWLIIAPSHAESTDAPRGWDANFWIVVENIYTGKEHTAYFGIRGYSHHTYWDSQMLAQAAPLHKELEGIGFESESGWYLAFKYFRNLSRKPFFEQECKSSMLRLLEESGYGFPTADWLAAALSTFLRLSKPTLDVLNAAAVS